MILKFGKNLAYLRKLNKLEQKDVAKLVNKSYATVSMWETGRRTGFVGTCFVGLLGSFCAVFSPF